MFVTLVGVTFLFGMASQNGTLELFSKKIVALVGKRTVLIPVLMFVLSAFISAIGPGHIAAGILMTTFAIYLAFEMDMVILQYSSAAVLRKPEVWVSKANPWEMFTLV